MTVSTCIVDMLETRTIETQIVQKLKDSEARPNIPTLIKKKNVYIEVKILNF